MVLTLPDLWFVADHDVVLHGVGDVVDSEHQPCTIFHTGKARSGPSHHVAGRVLSVNGPHIRLRETEGLLKITTCNLCHPEKKRRGKKKEAPPTPARTVCPLHIGHSLLHLQCHHTISKT